MLGAFAQLKQMRIYLKTSIKPLPFCPYDVDLHKPLMNSAEFFVLWSFGTNKLCL